MNEELAEALDVIEALLSGDKLSRVILQEDIDAALAFLHKHGRRKNIVSIR